MQKSAELADLLTKYQKQHPQLQGWRFDLQERNGLEIGIKNNRIGGPYSAPSYKRSISGEIYLLWENNYFTLAKLDSEAIAEFASYIQFWSDTAYFDEDGAGLNTPAQIPSLLLEDDYLNGIVNGNFEPAFELLTDGLRELTNLGMTKIDGKIRCYRVERSIVNSTGLLVEYPSTPVEFFFEVNDSYGEAYQEKKWPDPSERERVIVNTGKIGKALSRNFNTNHSGLTRLVFPPGIFESFLNQFLFPNLSGTLVANRQSRFNREDFEKRLKIGRSDFDLRINNLLPQRAFSYPCTSEGVPGGEIDLITQGCLASPLLDLKYAKKLGLKPTPLPNGGRGYFFSSRLPVPDWNDFLRTVDEGLIVYSVLGLHTQDPSSGRFSLNADQCLWVEHGEIQGKVKAVINGDFLGSLNTDTSQLATVAGEDNPAFSFIAGATCYPG